MPWAGLPILAQAQSWAPLGPDYAGINVIERDRFDPRTLYAGAFFGGLYRSFDEGVSWSYVPSPAAQQDVVALASDPSTRGVLYIGGFQSGVYKTLDSGLTWRAVNHGLDDLHIRALAVDPFDSRRVLAATALGAYMSIDGGESWKPLQTGAEEFAVATVAFDPVRRGHWYLGTNGRAVARTTDGGLTWRVLNAVIGDFTVKSLRFDAAANTLYAVQFAVTFGGVFKLDLAGGATAWQDLTYDLPRAPINDVLLAPDGSLLALTNLGVHELAAGATGWVLAGQFAGRTGVRASSGSRVIVATLDQGLLVSETGRPPWVASNRGFQNLFVEALAVSVVSGATRMHAGTDTGVWVSGNGGGTWANGGGFNHTVFTVEPHPTDSNVAFCGTERNGLFRSSDGGLTWQQKSNGLVPPGVTALGQAPAGKKTLYAATTVGLFLSTDNAASWKLATSVPLFSVRTMAFDPNRPDAAFFGTAEGRVFVTLDGGESFEERAPILPDEAIVSLAVSAVNQVFPVIYAVTVRGRLFTSGDDGKSWFELQIGVASPVQSVLVHASRPATVYVATATQGVRKSGDNGSTWGDASNGIDPPIVLGLAADASGDRIYAASRGRVYRSTDGGASWASASGGLPPEGVVRSLVVDDTNADVMHAQVEGVGVMSTVDGGRVWTTFGLTASVRSIVTSVGLGPATPGRIYAGTALEGVFASDDRGNTWRAASNAMTMFVRGISVKKTQPQRMFAGSLFGGMFASSDGAESWRNTGLFGRVIHSVHIHPANPDHIYAGTAGGVARSTDDGETWVILGQRTAFVYSLLFRPGPGEGTIYVGGINGGIYKSVDGGSVFSDIGTGLPAHIVTVLERHDATGTLYAVLAGRGLYRSRDDGASWQLLADRDWWSTEFTTLVVEGDGRTIYLGTEEAGVLVSRDAGASWSFFTLGLESLHVSSIAVDPTDATRIYAATALGMYWWDKTLAQPQYWQRLGSGFPRAQTNRIAVDPRLPGFILAATNEGMYRSEDSGSTWTLANQGLGTTRVIVLLVDPFDASTVYAGTLSSGVSRSIDGGRTWQAAIVGIGSGEIRALARGANPGTVFAGTLGAGLDKTFNHGNSWFGGASGTILPSVHWVGVHASDPKLLYAATGGQGVLRSLDGGLHWAAVNRGLDDLELFSLAVDPTDSKVVYAGTRFNGVYMTRDGGDNWRALPLTGLYSPFVTSLAVDPLDHNILYAGTEGGGAFRMVVTNGPDTRTPTQTMLATSGTPSKAGDSVTFTATVSGAGVPGGNVQFLANGQTIIGCSVSTLVLGVARCTTAALAAGVHQVTARYSGSSTHKPSVSAALSQVVKGATSAAVTSSANPVAAGVPVTLNAAVFSFSGTPTGTFLFRVGGAAIAGCIAVPIGLDGARCTTTFATPGTHLVTAEYSGDEAFTGSVSKAFQQTVTGALRAVAFDFSGDGYPDIVWHNTDGRSALWLMRGATQTGGRALFGAGTGWTPRLIGDFDGDGKADILWEHTDGRAYVWLMDGTAQVGGGSLLAAGTGWRALMLGDFNGDGRADIVWQHTDGRVAIWLMNGATQAGGAALLTAGTGWTARLLADFNGDGRSDILWQHADGRTAIWLMNGGTQIGGGLLIAAGTGWSAVRTGDFDGDGKADILWEHTDGRAAMWLMNGATQAGGASLLAAGSGWRAAAVADFDADGHADIVWQRGDGTLSLWIMRGTSQVGGATQLADAGNGLTVRRAQDFNADGRADLLLQHANGEVRLWIMNGAGFESFNLIGPETGWTPVANPF